MDTHAYLLELDPEMARYYPEAAVISTTVWFLFGCLFCRKLENDWFMTPVMTSEQVSRHKWQRVDRGKSWFSLVTTVLLYKFLQTVGIWLYP